MSNPKIAIVSPFRQSGSDKVDAYFSRAYALNGQERLAWYLVEGDSTDDTFDRLSRYEYDDSRILLIKSDTGRPHYGSTIHPERFKNLAQVFNAGLDAVDLDWADFVMFLPSDVFYEPDLVDRLAGWNKDLIAPMFWADEGNHGRFYDIWGFRHQGQSFQPATPAWFEANFPQSEPLEMDTVGGCIVMRSEVLKAGCRYTESDVDHGLCRAAQAAGFRVWADLHTHIFHP